MKPLPDDLKPYRRTDTFTLETVPRGLMRDHRTKAGVWGVIHVTQGSLIYRTAKDASETLLTPDVPGIIEPEILHSVSLSDGSAFYVEFWR
ncbi:MAG: DUF1971 domain-containing protein [Pseudomonadota bacterium]